ncbi:hypothetical protein ACJX0J_029779, partial [Zea mays]
NLAEEIVTGTVWEACAALKKVAVAKLLAIKRLFSIAVGANVSTATKKKRMSQINGPPSDVIRIILLQAFYAEAGLKRYLLINRNETFSTERLHT